jgi:hypothetical protein
MEGVNYIKCYGILCNKQSEREEIIKPEKQKDLIDCKILGNMWWKKRNSG